MSLASPIAVKLMAPEVAKTTERLRRFSDEARAAAALRSSHVVHVLDHGVDGGTPFIAMELLQGESLATRLERAGRLDPGETELVIRHVSRALGLAHDQGIVHRDLTPANIFITRDEDEQVIKLLDFGIAKVTRQALGTFSKGTRTGSFLGTPAYVSPEQLEESKLCDHRTDIWAMGVLAFECLLGHMPFGGAGIGGLVLDICSRPLPLPSEHGSVPAGFDAWFFRACARDLDERFGSVREAAQALRLALVPRSDVSLPAPSRACAPPSSPVGADVAPAAASAALRAEAPAEHSSTLRSSPGISSTSAASSVTLDHAGPRRALLPGLLLLLSAAFLVSVLVWRGLYRPRTLEEAPVQALQPPVVTAGLEVLSAPNERVLTFDAPQTSQSPVVELAPLPPEPSVEPRSSAAKPPRVRGSRPRTARRPRAANATLTIESAPPAAVLLDGMPLGKTPLRAVPVTPGTHKILFIQGSRRQTRFVDSVAGRHRLVSASFEAR